MENALKDKVAVYEAATRPGALLPSFKNDREEEAFARHVFHRSIESVQRRIGVFFVPLCGLTMTVLHFMTSSQSIRVWDEWFFLQLQDL